MGRLEAEWSDYHRSGQVDAAETYTRSNRRLRQIGETGDVAVIVHLVDAFARDCPDLQEAQHIKTLCDRLLGTITTADISKGRN